MIPVHVLKFDEYHIGIEVSKIYKNEYRFPVEMTMKGRMYSEVEATLNKPHGKKIIMEFIIKLLLKGPKQYKPFINQALQRFIWLDVNDSIEILLLAGILQITFKNLNPRKTVDWLPKVIQLAPKVIECLTAKMLDYNLEIDELKNSVMDLLINSKSFIKEHILQWFQEKKIRDISGSIIADYISFKKYKSIVLAVAYYINLKENGQSLPLRYLSNQIWSQPSLLNAYKNEIALSARITLEELDSILLPDINNTLHAPLIVISPVEKLQELLVKLLEPEIHPVTIKFYMNEINNSIQRIIGIIGESIDSDFLSAYSNFNKKFIEGNSQEDQKSIINNLKHSINELKKQMLKIDHIKQKFELIVLEEIGSGSFARVYKVFDPESLKIVACKVLFPKSYFKQVYGNDGDEYILRFKREVRLLTKELQHKNIVEVMKIQLEGSLFWFTMPLASFSLEKWVRDNRYASIGQRIKVFNDILSGVSYLHEKNKYHRDLAPSNILLYKTDIGLEVKIADFGLAKDPKSMSFFTGFSKRGYGQEYFTDPKQLNNLANSTHLSDIYSLGALLYYMLSGNLPKPKKMRYDPVFCQNIITKAMEKEERRYHTLYEFESDLNYYIQKLENTYKVTHKIINKSMKMRDLDEEVF